MFNNYKKKYYDLTDDERNKTREFWVSALNISPELGHVFVSVSSHSYERKSKQVSGP